MALIGSITEGNSLVGSLNSTGTLEGAIVGAKGDPGEKGDPGDTGNGIASIAKTGTAGLVDTYTITYTNGNTATFTVTNGEQGATGADGHTPVMTASKVGKVTTVSADGTPIATINDGDDGDTGDTGERGGIIHRITAAISGYTTPVGGFTPVGRCLISSILSQSGADKVIVGDVLAKGTFLYGVGAVDSTYAYTTAGNDLKGDTGSSGQDGADGHSPVVTASKTGKVTTVYVDGTAVATINDGQDGTGSVADVTQNGVSVLDGTTAKVTVPTKVSDLTNDSGYITGYTETDPTVPSWAKQSTKPTYTATEVGALPSTTQIPSKTSDLQNDSGFITGYTETDPVFLASAAHGISSSDISAWNAKQSALGTLTVTLTVVGWSSNAQTVAATGVTSSNTVIVSPSPSDMEDYTDAGIVCTAQGTNSLTFECDTTPSSAIDVNVVII